MYNPPTKLTAANRRELRKLAPAVSAALDEHVARKRTRNVHFSAEPTGWKLNLGEGMKYQIFAPNGKMLATNMVSERTFGAANDGVNYHVNQETPPLPEGTWVIECDLFLGKWRINLYYIGVAQLTTLKRM